MFLIQKCEGLLEIDNRSTNLMCTLSTFKQSLSLKIGYEHENYTKLALFMLIKVWSRKCTSTIFRQLLREYVYNFRGHKSFYDTIDASIFGTSRDICLGPQNYSGYCHLRVCLTLLFQNWKLHNSKALLNCILYFNRSAEVWTGYPLALTSS